MVSSTARRPAARARAARAEPELGALGGGRYGRLPRGNGAGTPRERRCPAAATGEAIALLAAARARPETQLMPARLDRLALEIASRRGASRRCGGPSRRCCPEAVSTRPPSPAAGDALRPGPWRIDMDVAALVRREVAKVLSLRSPAEVPEQRPLKELGFDSLSVVELRSALSARLRLPLPASVAFDYPTVAALSEYLMRRLGVPGQVPAVQAGLSPGGGSDRSGEPIAIVGIGCCFPGPSTTSRASGACWSMNAT